MKQGKIVYGALAGAGLFLVQPFLYGHPRDPSARVAVIAFSLAIPMLAALLCLTRKRHFADIRVSRAQ